MTHEFDEDKTEINPPCFKCVEKSSCKVYAEGDCPKHNKKKLT